MQMRCCMALLHIKQRSPAPLHGKKSFVSMKHSKNYCHGLLFLLTNVVLLPCPFQARQELLAFA